MLTVKSALHCRASGDESSTEVMGGWDEMKGVWEELGWYLYMAGI